MNDTDNRSDVARLRRQIALEYEAAQRGLAGLALGNARHDFINARIENMGRHQEALARLVGPEQAAQLLAETLENL